MDASRANLLNSVSLIVIGLWGYFAVSSVTALIPVAFGVTLLLCFLVASNKPDLNHIVTHIAVLLTLIILLALVGMRLPTSLDAGGMGLLRVLVMIGTSALATVFFVKSFIDARRNR